MFPFSRRAIEARLHALEGIVNSEISNHIAKRLNTPGRHRLGAMWEAIFYFAFSQVGTLQAEQPTVNGTKPDITFTFRDESKIGLVADITAVSDEGLDEANPIQELLAEITGEAKKMGLPPGGITLLTKSREEPRRSGTKRFLQIPSRKKFPELLPKLFEEHIRPFLAEAKVYGKLVSPLCISISEEPKVWIYISYNGSRFSTVSYPSYDHATSLEANPIMNRLKDKARTQLKGVGTGILKGLIVCDADCANLQTRATSPSLKTFSPELIAREFLRQDPSFDFIIFSTVASERQELVNDLRLVTLVEGEKAQRLRSLSADLARHLPKPVMSVENAALRCKEEGVGENKIGGYQMSRDHIRVSARALMNVLSGKMSQERWESQHQWPVNPFLLRTTEGRGIVKATLICGADADDDWIEFTFGQHDAAMAPFTARKQSEGSE